MCWIGLGIGCEAEIDYNDYKSIDNQLKSVQVIRPIKSINEGNSSHLMFPVTSLFAVAYF